MKKILVIDDDLAILEVIKIILEENGYAVTVHANGADAVAVAEKLLPEVILIDIWISGFDGKELTKELKENKKTKEIPVVMVSAKYDAEKVAKEAGADAFLPKPFDITDLLAIVERYSVQTDR